MGEIDDLIQVLKEEIAGVMLAEVVSKRNRGILTVHGEENNEELAPVVNYLELLTLAILYRDGEMKPEELDKKVKEHYWNGVFPFVLSRLISMKLVEGKGDNVSITDRGRKLVEDALSLKDGVIEAIKKDSFFGWAYRELNRKAD